MKEGNLLYKQEVYKIIEATSLEEPGTRFVETKPMVVVK